MDDTTMCFGTKSELLNLLNKVYEAGSLGYLDLKDSCVSAVLEEYLDKQKNNNSIHNSMDYPACGFSYDYSNSSTRFSSYEPGYLITNGSVSAGTELRALPEYNAFGSPIDWQSATDS